MAFTIINHFHHEIEAVSHRFESFLHGVHVIYLLTFAFTVLMAVRFLCLDVWRRWWGDIEHEITIMADLLVPLPGNRYELRIRDRGEDTVLGLCGGSSAVARKLVRALRAHPRTKVILEMKEKHLATTLTKLMRHSISSRFGGKTLSGHAAGHYREDTWVFFLNSDRKANGGRRVAIHIVLYRDLLKFLAVGREIPEIVPEQLNSFVHRERLSELTDMAYLWKRWREDDSGTHGLLIGEVKLPADSESLGDAEPIHEIHEKPSKIPFATRSYGVLPRRAAHGH